MSRAGAVRDLRRGIGIRVGAGPLTGLLTALLVALLTLLLGPLAGPAPALARAQRQPPAQTGTQIAGRAATQTQPDADLPLQVVLDSLAPAIPRPKGRLTVSGHVVNSGDATVKDVSVRLRLSRIRVVSRGDLEALGTGQSVRDGSPVDQPGASVTAGDLVPGATAPFTLTVPLDALRLGALGVFPLSVEARGVQAGGQDAGYLRRLGITRTFLPWAPDPLQAVPTRLAWVWPLADVPHRRVDGVFVDDELATELAPGGRLQGLVQAAAGKPVTWLVDPMLLDDARAMSQGYRVAVPPGGQQATPSPAPSTPGPDGTTKEGTGGQAARAFLSQLVAATGTADVAALPFGDLDVQAALAQGPASVLSAATLRGQSTATDVLGRPVTTSLAAPPDGFAGTGELSALRATGSTAALLDERALPPRTGSTAIGSTHTGRATVTVTGDGGRPVQEPVVLWDDVLTRLAAGTPTGPDGELLARQRFLAETEMVTAERPGVQRTVLIAPPHDWAVDPQRAAQLLSLTAAAPWLKLVTVHDALSVPPPDVERGPLVATPPAGTPGVSAPLPGSYVRSVGATVAGARTASTVLKDPTRLRNAYEVEGERMLSASLRTDLARGRSLLAHTRDSLAGWVSAVRILPTSATLGSSEAQIPVTVVNDLDQAVTVQVRFSSGSPRLSVHGPGTVTVDPGSKRRVLVPVAARANGVIDVSAQLLTPAGEPLGDPVPVRVRIAQYGLAGILVTAGAALLLFLGAAHNVWRRLRRRGTGADGADGADGLAGSDNPDNPADVPPVDSAQVSGTTVGGVADPVADPVPDPVADPTRGLSPDAGHERLG